MTASLTLVSGKDQVVHFVGDFARGLGCAVVDEPSPSGHSIRIELPEAAHVLVELLTHVALSATRAGVDVAEPLCHVTYRHSGVASAVNMAIRITEFGIDTSPAAVS